MTRPLDRYRTGVPPCDRRWLSIDVNGGSTRTHAAWHALSLALLTPERTRDEELLSNYLVILTEDISRPKITVMMLMLLMVVVMNFVMRVNIGSCHVLEIFLVPLLFNRGH